MRKILHNPAMALIASFIFLFPFVGIAQVTIGSNATPHGSTVLDIVSTTRGVSFPQVPLTTTLDPLNGVTPKLGTVVYNPNGNITGATANGAGFYYWDGGQWVKFSTNPNVSSTSWLLTGNTGTNAANNFIGTTDGVDLIVKTAGTDRIHILGAANGQSQAGWVGIGTTLPRSRLDVVGIFGGKNVVTIQNTASDGYSSIDMLDNTNATAGTFGFGNSTVGTALFQNRAYFNSYDHDFVITNTGLTPNFLITSSGNVGIGTATPNSASVLDITSSTKGVSFPQVSLANTTTKPATGNPTPKDGTIVYNTNGGITGTTANGVGLYEWIGGATGQWVWIRTFAGTAADSAWITGGNSNGKERTIGTNDNFDLPFETNGTEKMRLGTNGRLGIGTATPTNKLSIIGTAPTDDPLLISRVQTLNTPASTDSVLAIKNGVVKQIRIADIPPTANTSWLLTGNNNIVSSTNFLGSINGADLVVKTANGERMRILGAVNGSSLVGWISMGGGQSIPRSPVDMAGNFTGKNVLTIQNTNTAGYSSIDLLDAGGTQVGTFGYANSATSVPATGRVYIYSYGKDILMSGPTPGNPDFFVQGTTANIGIGTNTPAARLDVIGTVRCTSLTQTSDIRLKRNISPVKYGLQEILHLDPISYTFKADKTNKINLGLSAQQLQNILPEVVDEGTDADKTLAVNYTEIIPVLINAIKEQQTQIEELTARVKALEQKNK